MLFLFLLFLFDFFWSSGSVKCQKRWTVHLSGWTLFRFILGLYDRVIFGLDALIWCLNDVFEFVGVEEVAIEGVRLTETIWEIVLFIVSVVVVLHVVVDKGTVDGSPGLRSHCLLTPPALGASWKGHILLKDFSPASRWNLLEFCHGVDQNSEKIFFDNDYPNPPLSNFILFFFVIFIEVMLLVAKEFLEGSCDFISGCF